MPLLVLTSRVHIHSRNNPLHLATMNFTNILLKHCTLRLYIKSVTFLLLEILVTTLRNVFHKYFPCATCSRDISISHTSIFHNFPADWLVLRGDCGGCSCCGIISLHNTLCNTNTWDTHPQWHILLLQWTKMVSIIIFNAPY